MDVYELGNMLSDLEFKGGEAQAAENKVAKLQRVISETREMTNKTHQEIKEAFRHQEDHITNLRAQITSLNIRIDTLVGERMELTNKTQVPFKMDPLASGALSSPNRLTDLARIVILHMCDATEHGPKVKSDMPKILACKALRSMTGLGLKEVKDAVELAGTRLGLADFMPYIK